LGTHFDDYATSEEEALLELSCSGATPLATSMLATSSQATAAAAAAVAGAACTREV